MRKLFAIILTLIAWCGAASAQFSTGQFVTNNFIATVNTVHAPGYLPTAQAYNGTPLIDILPFVTTGAHPLIQGGAGSTIKIYGIGSDNNIYNITQAVWMSTPQLVSWSGGIFIPNHAPNPNNVLILGGLSPAQVGPGGATYAPTFTEIAPATGTWQASTAYQNGIQIVDSNGNIEQVIAVTGNAMTGTSAPVWPTHPLYTTIQDNNVTWILGEAATAYSPPTNIQVSCVVVTAALLPSGSGQGWSFNDLVNTLAPGSSPPAASYTYDINVAIPGIPPYTSSLRNVPQSSLTLVP